MKLEEMQDIIDKQNLQVDEYMRSSRALLHGPAGSIMAKTVYGIKDRDIQNSIFFHTTGRPQMELLDKIIFLADYIEPSRDFPGINIIRRNAQKIWIQPSCPLMTQQSVTYWTKKSISMN